MTCHARTGFRRCGTSWPQLSSGPLGRHGESHRVTQEINLHRILILTLVLLLLISGCKKDSLVMPSIPEANLVTNGSFESNGAPTLEGWTGQFNPDTSLKRYYIFSNDVPPGGGQWSFSFNNPAEELWLWTDIPIPGPMHNYQLTLWGKSTLPFTNAILYVSASGYRLFTGKNVEITDSTWKEYTITLGVSDSSLYASYPDSIRTLRVQFESSNSPRGGKAFFDLVQLER